MRRMPLLLTALLVAAGACSQDTEAPLEPQLSVHDAGGKARTYAVTVKNLTGGQPFTPPLAAVHGEFTYLWQAGRGAGHEIQQIAENGNLGPMLEHLGQEPGVGQVLVVEGPTLPPLLPGEEVTFEITAEGYQHFISIVSMLICTNDGFTGVAGRPLPADVGGSHTWYARGYDAGTESNTEDFADLVPPCAPLTGVQTDDAGTGMTNWNLYEHKVVRVHDGIRGDTDLGADVHGWTGPTAAVRVERIS